MPAAGTFPGNFTSCLYNCPSGYYGDSPHLTAATGPAGCKPCTRGHFCPTEATSHPSPCPAGSHMPAQGASSDTSCIPCAPGTHGPLPANANATCEPCAKGSYSALTGQTECTLYDMPRPHTLPRILVAPFELLC